VSAVPLVNKTEPTQAGVPMEHRSKPARHHSPPGSTANLRLWTRPPFVSRSHRSQAPDPTFGSILQYAPRGGAGPL